MAAARFAFLFPFKDAMQAVIHVPIFCPNKTKALLDKEMRPCEANVCKIPIDADELWMTAVNKAPAKMP